MSTGENHIDAHQPNGIVHLVKKSKLFIKPVETFVWGEFYDSSE